MLVFVVELGHAADKRYSLASFQNTQWLEWAAVSLEVKDAAL